jgi:hypothetical protein
MSIISAADAYPSDITCPPTTSEPVTTIPPKFSTSACKANIKA